MTKVNTIGFLYQVKDIRLQPFDDNMQMTDMFVVRDVIDEINEKFKAKNFKVDESTVRSKYIDQVLHLEGFAKEIREPKTVGFFSSKREQ